MDNELKREYTARISQANRSELVVIIYELFDYAMDTADKAFAKEDIDTAVMYLRKAQGLVNELRGSLDFQYEVSLNLANIYRYVNEQIVASIVKKQPVNIDAVRENMDKLGTAFNENAKQDTSGPVMKNTQQVYAGLTYGKGTLNEVFMNSNESSRGFRA